MEIKECHVPTINMHGYMNNQHIQLLQKIPEIIPYRLRASRVV